MSEYQKTPYICRLCPRNCGATRHDAYGDGFCHSGMLARVARAAPHLWEEPCISGTDGKGSGTVFFCGCSLGCIYCQNHDIRDSRKIPGYDSMPLYDAQGLRSLYASLISQGVHNINLVTPTHYTPVIADSLEEPLSVPVVWNSGGYEKAETLKMLRGKVQIYLADMKYGEGRLASDFSFAPDYFARAKEAIGEMFDQVGPCEYDDNGLLKRGLIVRHLVLPDCLDNTFDVLDWFSDTYKKRGVLLSLMCQYTPQRQFHDFPALSRKLTEEEYRRASEYMLTLGIFGGFLQDPESAVSSYTPDFLGRGNI